MAQATDPKGRFTNELLKIRKQIVEFRSPQKTKSLRQSIGVATPQSSNLQDLSLTKLFQDIAAAATVNHDLSVIASETLNALNKHMNLIAGDVKILNKQTQYLTLLSSIGFPEATLSRIQNIPLSSTEYLTTEAIRRKKMLTHNDEILTPVRLKILEEAGLTDSRYVITSIYAKNDLVGTLSLVFKGRRDFTETELDLFLSISHIIGQSIENARLYTELTKMESELRMHHDHLEELVKERTIELNTANQQLQQEINDRKETEEALRLSEELFSIAFNASPNPMFITRLHDGVFIDVNDSFLRSTGYKRKEVIGCKISKLDFWVKPDKRETMIEILNKQGTVHNLEIHFHLKSREIRIALFSTEKITLRGEQCLLSTLNDITNYKELEKEMAHLDRLNLVGEMAASIGHEVRNPLTTVKGFLQMLGSKKELSEHKEHFDLMIDELDRANCIITEFLSLAKDKTLKLEPQNLNHIVETLTPLIQADAMLSDKYVELQLKDVPDILINIKEIRQLILNLTRNGLEAMPSGGTLTIKTLKNETDVILSVQDQGKGIEPHLIEKLGTPFFTTKEQGTGLGLAVCYSIAARHNASIKVDTSPTGTTFSVSFQGVK